MDVCRGELLGQQISKFSPMSISEGLAVQRRVFAAGVASRSEAEILFDVCGSFPKSDCAWKQAFVTAITDHLLGQGEEYGFLEFDAEDWLIDMVSNDSQSHAMVNFEVLQSVLAKAKNASTRLAGFGLSAALKAANIGTNNSAVADTRVAATG
ncbi:MAG: hypothetical protein JKY46_02665 [Robiginitomaculum sp.]|nr:hypothetical protein [Robiginitomaculum sp.]